MNLKRALYLSAATAAALFYLTSDHAQADRTPLPPFENTSAVSSGALISEDGQLCPLEHTDVEARITGFLSRVTVTQQFTNPFDSPIEAIYTFPLPQMAAVDDMTFRIGDRIVKGTIKERDEARRIYENAKAQGQLAGLLDQERPNIFTQAMANIRPGDNIEVEISYVETLKYDEGEYEFSFPMVVGPRYMPGTPTGKQAGGWSPDTTQVPDASKLSPNVAPPGTRAGHDISIAITLDAGLPLRVLSSPTHEILSDRSGSSEAGIRLKEKAVLPNKDFILRYSVAGREIGDSVLSYQDDESGYFTLVLQPPQRVTVEDVTPKELVFVLDTSGSMSGFPIEKAKETMKLALDGLYPRDTFNLITFAGETKVLFEKPVPATMLNLAKAQAFLAARVGGGGTEMMKAIRTALEPSRSSEHVRIVTFMTDGYVGNDQAILEAIQEYSNARVFSFGIGSSTNRFLLDRMAELSRGEVEYVGLNDDGSAAARRLHERIRNPLLTDVEVDFGNMPVIDVYPKRIPDLFSAKPVVIKGRFAPGAAGTIRLTGKMSGRHFSRSIPVDFPRASRTNDAIAKTWARAKIADLMNGGAAAAQAEVTQLGLAHRLMTQFTSFVAVEESYITEAGKARRVEVAVEMPEGVSHEGVFGRRDETRQLSNLKVSAAAPMAQSFESHVSPPFIVKEAEKKLEDGRSSLDAPSKLDQSLRSLASQPGIEVAVEIWLVDATPEVLAKLKELGFEQTEQSKVAKILIGKIDSDKLTELSNLEAIRYIKQL